MNESANFMRQLVLTVAVVAAFFGMASPVSAQMSQSPMVIRQPEPPLIMLTVGRDEKLYYPAYNDYSDVDGDGFVDVDYKPGVISYYGLFDSNLCYDYSTTNSRFEPRMAVVDATLKTCGTSVAWSGDFLNYLTTGRVDVLRKVFYGGKRSTDTATTTVLERAYIPQDAHSWGKEYNRTRSSYLVSNYTPLAQPTGDALQHLFGNATVNATADPLLRVLTNRQERIWNWVAKEGPVVGGNIDPGEGGVGGGGVTPTDYVVRVLVCVKSASFPLENTCKGYPTASPTVWKPTGILHDYGESRNIAFGLLTGSYDNARKGGVVRSNVGYFDLEINADGTFKSTVNGIVSTLDKLRIAQWSGTNGGGGSFNCNGGCKDYGSPIAEMMYEGLRYFGGSTTPTAAYAYTNAGSVDNSLGLPYVGQGTTPWLDPFRGKSNGGFAACSKPVQMVVSDVTPTFDSDDLPGSSFAAFAAPSTPASMTSLNVTTLGSNIWNAEGLGSQRYFIGNSLANVGNPYDQAPTAKLANSFGTIRGLAPGEPTRQGSYYAASVAKFGAENSITSAGSQKVETYAVALTPPLPTIKIPTPLGTVSIIPFGKSVGGCNYGEFVAGTTFLTNRIVGFYFNNVFNMPGFPNNASATTGNSGRPVGTFRVSFEDNEQGTDNDMDAIVVYKFALNADNTVTIELSSEYAAGCIDQNMGFVISGTTTDGAFLGVRDIGGGGAAYALNDPAFSYDNVNAAGNPIYPNDGVLHLRYKRTFTPSTASGGAGSIPHDPLWYAAKYGVPSPTPWDADGDGVPDNYALVTNPSKLRSQISAALERILSKSQVSPSVATTGNLVRTDASIGFSGRYAYGSTSIPRTTGTPITATTWEGGLDAVKINDNGTLGATVWTVTNSSFPSVGSRKISTKIGSTYQEFNGINVLTDTALRDLMATGSMQLLLSPSLVAQFGPMTSAQLRDRTAQAVVAYLRGDQTLEQGNTPSSSPPGPLRPRKTLLGDVVHSLPVYQGKQDYGYGNIAIPGAASYATYVATKRSRTELVWVGANDGMLHAFNARTGGLVWSFVPKALQASLPSLLSQGYSHQYFMDGQIAVADVYTGSAWKTIVVASAGAGAKTVVAIDATDPSAPVPIWEATANDLGYVLGALKIVRVNNSAGADWAVIFGNGYESAVPVSGGGTKTVARLFVLNALTGASLGNAANLTVPDSIAYNGMGVPALVGDTFTSDVWVGDLAGNLWKFDLSDGPSAWKNPLPSSAPLFKAERASVAAGNPIIPQPITSEPAVTKSLSRGYFVSFGTGKFFQESDRTSTEIQSAYTVRDIATGYQLANNAAKVAGSVNLRRSNLGSYSITESGGYRRLVAGSVPSTSYGWYVDLAPSGQTPGGERILSVPVVYLPTVYFGTFSAQPDVCSDGSKGWFMAFNLVGGGESDVFDTNGDGVITSADAKRGGVQLTAGGVESGFGLVASADGTKMSFVGVPGAERGNTNTRGPVLSSKGGVGQLSTNSGRFSWRQVQ